MILFKLAYSILTVALKVETFEAFIEILSLQDDLQSRGKVVQNTSSKYTDDFSNFITFLIHRNCEMISLMTKDGFINL